MRDIHLATKAKVRIRGRGSGYLEVDGKSEAPVPLMVVVTADKKDADAFKRAIQMTLSRLQHVEERYKNFCSQRNIEIGGNLFSLGEQSRGSEELLKKELEHIPRTTYRDSSSTASQSTQQPDAGTGGTAGSTQKASSSSRGGTSGGKKTQDRLNAARAKVDLASRPFWSDYRTSEVRRSDRSRWSPHTAVWRSSTSS